MLGKPYPIAKLPLSPTDGQIAPLVSDVFTLSKSKKRKQSEIVLATDHQSIDIYDYRTSKLVSSYVVSPKTKFTCPPCSFVTRSKNPHATQRYTYVSVRNPQPRLLCFREETSSRQSLRDVSTFFIEIEQKSPVIHLDVLPAPLSGTPESRTLSLLGVHEDGTVSAYLQNLDAQLWSEKAPELAEQPNPEQEQKQRILCSTLVFEREAVKSVLKDREDVLKTPLNEDGGKRTFLLTLEESHGTDSAGLLLKLYSIDSTTRDSSIFKSSRLSVLSGRDVPIPTELRGGESTFSFHIASGSLCQCHSNGVATYDLQSLTLRLLHLLAAQGQDIKSCQRISPNLLAVTDEHAVKLYAMPFASFQARAEISSVANNPEHPTKSRVHQFPPGNGSPLLLTFSASYNILIAIADGSLFAIPIRGSSVAQGSRKRNRDGSLLSSLGRNNPSTSIWNQQAQLLDMRGQEIPSDDPEWKFVRRSLEEHLKLKSYDGFESVMLEQLNKGPGQATPLQSQHIAYCLARIFRAAKDGPSDQQMNGSSSGQEIRIVFWPSQLCEWLIGRGLLAKSSIESALKRSGDLPVFTRLATGALIRAITRFDSTLNTLQSVIRDSSVIEDAEVCHALLTVTRQIGHLSQNHDMKSLTFGDASEKSDQKLGLYRHQAAPSPGLRNLLYDLLAKLKSQSSPSISRLLRQTFANSDMRALINILRVELARNGWLSVSDEDYEDAAFQNHTSDQITLIAHTLNSLIDALGPTGWILSSSSPDALSESAATLSYMKAEVSAALEGIEEATYLRQMLTEVLLRGKETIRRDKDSNGPSDRSKSIPRKQKPFRVPFEEQENFLSLSTKPKSAIPREKVGAGGEMLQRSKRDIGQLISRQVGKYTFERIEI